MFHLETLLMARFVQFSKEENRAFCLSHVINICSQHVGKLLEKETAELITLSEVDDSSGSDDEDARPSNQRRPPPKGIISKVRRGVQAVRCSGLRRDELQVVITSGNTQNMFLDDKGIIVMLPVVQLLHNVRTQWDSLFFMICRYRVLRQV